MGVEVLSPAYSHTNLADRARVLAYRIEGRIQLGLKRHAISYGLRRDLAVAIEYPSAKIPISVRPMTAADLEVLLPADTASLAPQDRIEVAWRTRFAEKFGLDGGHVAVDERSGQPCYMQWLLGPERNEAIARLKSFPRLAAGEAQPHQGQDGRAERQAGAERRIGADPADRAFEHLRAGLEPTQAHVFGKAREARQRLGNAADHHRAGARPGGDDAELGQFLQPLAQRRARHVERLGHLALGGQRAAGSNAAGIEHSGQRIAQPLAQGAVLRLHPFPYRCVEVQGSSGHWFVSALAQLV